MISVVDLVLGLGIDHCRFFADELQNAVIEVSETKLPRKVAVIVIRIFMATGNIHHQIHSPDSGRRILYLCCVIAMYS